MSRFKNMGALRVALSLTNPCAPSIIPLARLHAGRVSQNQHNAKTKDATGTTVNAL